MKLFAVIIQTTAESQSFALLRLYAESEDKAIEESLTFQSGQLVFICWSMPEGQIGYKLSFPGVVALAAGEPNLSSVVDEAVRTFATPFPFSPSNQGVLH